MQIQENISLARFSTMRLGGAARQFAEVTSEDELLEALDYANSKQLKVHLLGSGSNTIFQDEGFNGLVIRMKIMGINIKHISDGEVIITAGAGENWDEVVARSVEEGFCDIAALSLIPGTVGAAPVQNIGAYGQQISDVITSVRAFDTQEQTFIEIANAACNFSYRHSRFNTSDVKRFIITDVNLRLSRKTVNPPFYADIARYFAEHDINEVDVTPAQLRGAVSTVRVIKLPDPMEAASCGSFFKNPVVDSHMFEKLTKQHPYINETPPGWPQLPYWKQPNDTFKISAGWLVEKCGFKDFHDPKTGMATWKNQALVIVNESAESTDDLLKFKETIVTRVQEKFGITLAQEPEMVEA